MPDKKNFIAGLIKFFIMYPHHFVFFFDLSDIEPTNRIIIAPKELERVQSFKYFDMLSWVIRANRFVLEQESFDLIRYKYHEGRIIIARHSTSIGYKLDFTYYE